MALGDLLKKAANKGFNLVNDAVEKSKQFATENGLFEKQKTPEELEAERLAAEQAAQIEKAEKEKLAAQKREEKQIKKAQEIAKILTPTCDKGDCLWNSGKFYYTCGGDMDCPRIKTTIKSWGGEVYHKELWPYMKRLENIQKLRKEDSSSKEKEKDFLKELITEFMPNFWPHHNIFGEYILKKGFQNNFFELLWDIRNITAEDMGKKIRYFLWPCDVDVPTLIKDDVLNLNYSFYRDPSLYDRSFEDFKYTIKTFEEVYKKDLPSETIELIIEQLFDADGNIKPAGIGGPEAGFYDDTIWNTIASFE